MEARLWPAVCLLAVISSLGAAYRTTNFVVHAPTPQMAKEIGDAAEVFRHDLALEWLGHELPAWVQPCPITADVSPHKGSGGATSFMFERGTPYGWRMNIQGPHQRIMDSVLPHEVTHTIFATHFGRPLPRWADEGACTTVEHTTERTKQEHMLIRFLTTQPHSRGIAFNRMFVMKEYPHDILPLYAQGYSVARYLIGQGGKRKFVDYVGEGMLTKNWSAATKKYYEYASLGALQASWLAWVGNGSPDHLAVKQDDSVQVTSATAPAASETLPVYRAQNDHQSRGLRSGILASRSRSTTDRRTTEVKPSTQPNTNQSWYVRQNRHASGQRTSPKERNVFHPVDIGSFQHELADTSSEQPVRISASDTTPIVQSPDEPSSKRVLLEWSRDGRRRSKHRQPVRFDAPLSQQTTVLR